MEWKMTSKELPMEDGIYLVVDMLLGKPWVHECGFKVTSKTWCAVHGLKYDERYGGYKDDTRIIAWMEMPKPPAIKSNKVIKTNKTIEVEEPPKKVTRKRARKTLI